MRRPSVLIAIFALALAGSVGAQNIEWGVWATNFEIQGDNVIDPSFGVEIVFDENFGYAFSANKYWGDRWSTELAVYRLNADAAVDIGFVSESIDADTLEFIPITLSLQYHFKGAGSPLDFWLQAGGSYTFARDLSSADLADNGLGPVEVDDELSWLAGGGVSYDFNESWGIALDVKWMPLELDSVGPGGTEDEELEEQFTEKLEIDPIIVSVGFLYRF